MEGRLSEEEFEEIRREWCIFLSDHFNDPTAQYFGKKLAERLYSLSAMQRYANEDETKILDSIFAEVKMDQREKKIMKAALT